MLRSKTCHSYCFTRLITNSKLGLSVFKCINLCCNTSLCLGLIGVGVWMVVACEKDWPNDNTKQRCLAGSRPNRTFTSQTIAEDVPVMDILHGVHYRNKYCLLCNSVPDYYIHYWNLRIRCNIKPPEEYSLTEKIDFLLKYCPTRYKTIEKYILRR